MIQRSVWFSVLLVTAIVTGCVAPRPGAIARRAGDEIMVAGQMVHTGTRVVLWTEPDGYDAYRVERRFAPLEQSSWETSHIAVAELKSPNRYSLRKAAELTPEELERVRGGGWDLPLLQRVVDQFVIHFDAAGTSRNCFKILHDVRDLSVHFMLDVDGTIYQTLDVKERAWHATTSNTRSVGIEIANPGAFRSTNATALTEWYSRDSNGRVRVNVPERFGQSGFHQTNFLGHPARNELIEGNIQGQQLVQYDFTEEQYRALTHLTAALCKVLPNIRCDYPRDGSGQLLRKKLSDDELKNYQGVLGHYHVQMNKVVPGPAFQWDRVINGARALLRESKTKGGASDLVTR